MLFQRLLLSKCDKGQEAWKGTALDATDTGKGCEMWLETENSTYSSWETFALYALQLLSTPFTENLSRSNHELSMCFFSKS